MARVGEVLVHEGAVSADSLRRALTFQRYGGQGLRLGTILIGWNLADEDILLAALTHRHGCEGVSWETLSHVSPEIAALLPADLAQQVRAIPFKDEPKAVHIAFADPSDIAAVDRVSRFLRKRVIPAVALEIRILQAHALFYDAGIPPDHRPILFKLRETSEKTSDSKTPPRRLSDDDFPLSTDPPEISSNEPLPPLPAGEGRGEGAPPDLTLAPPPLELGEVEEIDEEDLLPPVAPAAPALEPEPAKEPTRPIRVIPLAVDPAVRRDLRQIPPGLWMGGNDSPEDLTNADALDERFEIKPRPPRPVPPFAGPPLPGRVEVVRVLVETLLDNMPRALVFGTDKEHLFGVYGKGISVPIDHVQMIHLLPADGSVLQRVRESRTAHFGRPANEHWPAQLAVVLGLVPPECAILPLESVNGLVGVLYADRAGAALIERDRADLTRAAAFLGNALGSPGHQS